MLNKILGNSSIKESSKAIEHFLSEEEKVINSFVIWRDELVVTTKGIYHIDKQGVSGKKRNTKFFPGKYIEGFTFQGSGSYDMGGELTIYVKTKQKKKKLLLFHKIGNATFKKLRDFLNTSFIVFR